jgi:hypothetical protein
MEFFSKLKTIFILDGLPRTHGIEKINLKRFYEIIEHYQDNENIYVK